MSSDRIIPAYGGLLTAGQAARQVGLTPMRVRQLIAAGRIPIEGRDEHGRALIGPDGMHALRTREDGRKKLTS